MVQTRSQTKAIASIAENTLIKVDPPLPHPKVWTKEHHWLAIGEEEEEVEEEVGEEDSGQNTQNQSACPGCADDFQPNQQAHIGPNGCLGDW